MAHLASRRNRSRVELYVRSPLTLKRGSGASGHLTGYVPNGLQPVAAGLESVICIRVRRKLSKLSPGGNASATRRGLPSLSPDPLRGPHLPQIFPCPGSPLISFGGTGHHELRGVGQLAPRRDRPCQKFAFRPGPKENSQCVREMPATETQGTHRDCLYQRRPFLGSC